MAPINQLPGRHQLASLTLLKWIQTWALIALGVLLASLTSSGIHFADNGTLLWVVVLLSLFNLLLRPFLIFFALPFVIFTFGLGILVINALLIIFTAKLVDGFVVASFWSALWAAIVISAVSFIANALLGTKAVRIHTPKKSPRSRPRRKDDDIIDV